LDGVFQVFKPQLAAIFDSTRVDHTWCFFREGN
jgi:hypothetical protein